MSAARSRSGQAVLKLVLNFRYVGDVNLRYCCSVPGHLVLHKGEDTLERVTPREYGRRRDARPNR